jgi:Concanavalin A-like lectin/glucanases superfamily/Galactose oxidase-like, Early set domain/Bacterial Ig domain/Glyoxal oxidase N-terminus
MPPMPRTRLPFILALLTVLGALACAPAAAQATTGPVAAYGFEDTGGLAVAGDSTSFGNTGTVVGGATRAAGRFGSAMSFDGVNDMVRIPDAGPVSLASGMTLEAWIKPTAVNGWRTVMLKGRRSDLSYALYGGPSAHVATNGVTGLVNGPASTANTWEHLAATYDGTTLRLYIDGTLAGSSTARSGPMTPGDGPLTIGGNVIWGEWFSGLIDEVRVYDRPLTAAEIQTDMATPVGNPATNPPGAPRDEVGAWSPPQTWPMVAVHASMLSNGKVVAWDAFSAAPQSEHIWDPTTETMQPAPSGINLFCSGHTLLPDGRLFVAGGHENAYVGLRNTMLLNSLTGSWTAGPDMAVGRWYPTTTTLADGRILIVSGDSITLNGPNTPFITPSTTLPEIYDPKTSKITAMPSASRKMPLYPFMFLTPDGRVVDAGPDTTTRILDPKTGLWSTLASQSPIDGHSAVMYRPGKILKSGTWTDTQFPGSVPVGNRAAVLDLDQTVPAWREVARMKWARTFHTLTVLPDGDVLALGGQSVADANSLDDSAVMQPEIWHPANDTWTPLANHVRPRGYHNTSLLLPDGRILLAGSGRLDGSLMTNEQTAEIYSPPYLFRGPRPTISLAPASMGYGQTISVETPDAAKIAKVSLVRTGAVTHNFNMDQRWQQLNFRQVGGHLEVDAPISPNDAPPGVYYLFLLDDKGVPSKAAILSISPQQTADTTAPSVPQNVSATGTLGKVTVNWSASTDNVGVARYVVHRSTTSGFTPSAGTKVATVTSGTSYADTGLAAGTYYYKVIAEDAAGNASAPSAEASGTAPADATAPTVSLSAPSAGATVRGTVAVSANATDDVGVASVQFRLDGNDLGSADTSAPYSVNWDTTTATAGTHTLTAIAADSTGNRTTAANVSVTVDNSLPAGPTPVAAYSFEDGSGTTLTDVTGKGHTGTIREAVWTTTGKYGGALRFDAVNDWVTINDAADLHLTNAITLEAWVNPTKNDAWRTAIMKERSGDLDWSLYASGSAKPSAWANTGGGMGSVTGTAAPALNTWTHLAATFDAATIRLYVNGTQVATAARSGNVTTSSGALRLGGNSLWGEWFAGQLDDVRIYDKVLTAAQIQSDMATPAGPPAAPDTQAPSVPQGVTATGALGKVTLSWPASSDNVGVARYVVHRSTTPGFTPGASTKVATVTSGTSYGDAGLAPGTYYYKVIAEDAAGNASAPSAEASGTAPADTTAPAVSVTAPVAGATVKNTVAVSAGANDDVGVAGVQFRLDGNDLGAEDASAPYSVNWDTTTASAGPHSLTAIARDGAGNRTTSASVSVTVDNSVPAGPAPVAAYSFEDGAGTTLTDVTGKGHTGAIREATWTTTGKTGKALKFDGVNDWVTIDDAADLHLGNALTLEVWVNPTKNTTWRTAIMKEGAGDLDWALYASGSAKPSAWAKTAGGMGTATGTAAPALNTWTHLAATYDAATIRLYVNGTQVATAARTGSLLAGGGPLHLAGNTLWGEWFAGQLDDVRIYDKVLTAAQIQADMNTPVS